ncbi:hypothetical protein NQ317_015424 [Molorchus minor]|uniref:Uncharacterized protein n=1 Tax=Molorchus minor TaxID=1323400 RepID=A0ABQ9ISX4_9CUCU|nr:hypothetical protein NQ317_015424 [Molorchus minor]
MAAKKQIVRAGTANATRRSTKPSPERPPSLPSPTRDNQSAPATTSVKQDNPQQPHPTRTSPAVAAAALVHPRADATADVARALPAAPAATAVLPDEVSVWEITQPR